MRRLREEVGEARCARASAECARASGEPACSSLTSTGMAPPPTTSPCTAHHGHLSTLQGQWQPGMVCTRWTHQELQAAWRVAARTPLTGGTTGTAGLSAHAPSNAAEMNAGGCVGSWSGAAARDDG
jgi:hypothetical protein